MTNVRNGEFLPHIQTVCFVSTYFLHWHPFGEWIERFVEVSSRHININVRFSIFYFVFCSVVVRVFRFISVLIKSGQMRCQPTKWLASIISKQFSRPITKISLDFLSAALPTFLSSLFFFLVDNREHAPNLICSDISMALSMKNASPNGMPKMC